MKLNREDARLYHTGIAITYINRRVVLGGLFDSSNYFIIVIYNFQTAFTGNEIVEFSSHF